MNADTQKEEDDMRLVPLLCLQVRLTQFPKGRSTSTTASLVAPPVGHLGTQMFVKCVEFKDIMEMSAISTIHFKISSLNKPMLSTTSRMDHKQPLVQHFQSGLVTPPRVSFKNLDAPPHHPWQNPFDFQYSAPQFQPPQPPHQKPTLESLMERFT